MAHKLMESPTPEPKKQKRFTLTMPKMDGKIGVSFYLGNTEYFLGLAVTEVVKEQIVKRRFVKAPKGKVFIQHFDQG